MNATEKWPKDLTGRPPRFDPDAITDPLIREEWRHLADYGWDDHRIARRLGLATASLTKMAERHRQRSTMQDTDNRSHPHPGGCNAITTEEG
ncbi:helix-turn-helix DNA binding domain protein [Gordonia phage Salvador]|uniref:Helix-turn-helix DNA binding domain protein n=2 Tax=Wizardvirus TaxID=2169658 RepID=A0A6M3TB59_9CAUD|nr:helix-turn-helix DNA binding domain protein [Gordonia phage Nubi]YP_010107695.1 helix-turn-helix DNA binding domain protein [Gordonia phage Evamon]QDH85193.1 helix-turn-helix DNA binding domain protein [Gordonia phage Nubi]QJD51554.1 helix-turn-helix DNA binding domain protein [Gordonia phage Evamon]UVK62381.1 helix-turn-helix DNA binding domain protein [Gordonia phage Salvador]